LLPRVEVNISLLCFSKRLNHTIQVSALQAQAQSGTMFQVASNFNCLEFGSVKCDIESGHYCTDLMSDSTQGPAAAGSCGLAAITQAHAAFYDKDLPMETWGQRKERFVLISVLELANDCFPQAS
jgi:hypothetical protein